MKTPEYLILIGGVLHFLTLIASVMVPKTLDWKGELAKLIPFLRTLFWVYGVFIVLTIIAFGVLSLLNFRELAGGETLARALPSSGAAFPRVGHGRWSGPVGVRVYRYFLGRAAGGGVVRL